MREAREEWLLGACAVGLFAFATALRPRLNRAYDSHRRVLDVAQIPKVELARAVSLGHTEWMTDILWVNATIYYGETLYAHLPAVYIERYSRTMMALDPRFRQSYTWGAQSMVYRTVVATEAEMLTANDILAQGLRQFPDDPELVYRYGMNLAFELAPHASSRPEVARRYRLQSAEYLRRAAIAGEGPPYLGLTAARYLIEAGRTHDAIEMLRDVLVRAEDPRVRDMTERLIARLTENSPEDEPTRRGLQEVEASRQRDYPYLPASLYLFVGEPVLHTR